MALDGKLAKRSIRQIAIDLYGEEKVAEEWHTDGTLRAAVRYRIDRSLYLMKEGYLRLAARR